MVDPPSADGNFQDTRTWLFPATTVTFRGFVGTVAGVPLSETPEAAEVPEVSTAVTMNV